MKDAAPSLLSAEGQRRQGSGGRVGGGTGLYFHDSAAHSELVNVASYGREHYPAALRGTIREAGGEDQGKRHPLHVLILAMLPERFVRD